MTREEFRKTGWKMSYEDFLKCDCTQCERENCIPSRSLSQGS